MKSNYRLCESVRLLLFVALNCSRAQEKALLKTVRHHASHISTRSFCFAGHLKIDYLISAQPPNRPWAAFLDMLCTSRCSRIDGTGTPSLTCYRKSEYWNNFIGIEAELPASLNLLIVIEPGWCYTFLARDQASRHASMDVCPALVLAGTERSGIWKLLRSSPFVRAGVWCFWGLCIEV